MKSKLFFMAHSYEGLYVFYTFILCKYRNTILVFKEYNANIFN